MSSLHAAEPARKKLRVTSASEHSIVPLVSPSGKQISSLGREVPPTHWGITRAQLRDFLEECHKDPRFESMSVRDLDRLIIRERYKEGRSVALTYNDENPKEINVIISHCCDGNAAIFLRRCLDLTEYTGKKFPKGETQVVLFICSLSQYQGTQEEINMQVKQGSEDMKSSAFAVLLQSVKKCGGCMIIIPCKELKEAGGLYSRLWCVWEVYSALVYGLPVYVDYTSELSPEPPETPLRLHIGAFIFLYVLFLVCSFVYSVPSAPMTKAFEVALTLSVLIFSIPVPFENNVITECAKQNIKRYYFGACERCNAEMARCGDPALQPNDDEIAIRDAITHTDPDRPNAAWAKIDCALESALKRVTNLKHSPGLAYHFTQVAPVRSGWEARAWLLFSVLWLAIAGEWVLGRSTFALELFLTLFCPELSVFYILKLFVASSYLYLSTPLSALNFTLDNSIDFEH